MSKLAYLQTHFRDNGQGSPLTQGSRHGEAELPQPRDFSHMLWVFWLLGERGTPHSRFGWLPPGPVWTQIRGEGLRCAQLERLEPTQPVLGSSFHDQRPEPVRWEKERALKPEDLRSIPGSQVVGGEN